MTLSKNAKTQGTIAIVITLFLAAADSTIVSTVLPIISNQLGHYELYPWIMSSFLLPLALISPLSGACGDKFGIEATLKFSLIIFLIASIIAALSLNIYMLIFARLLQGIGASGIIVLSYSFLARLFDAENRGKMQGLLSGVWGISAILGPIIGSLLTHLFGWHTIFWFNIPLGIIAFILLSTKYSEINLKEKNSNLKLDWISQLLLIILTSSILINLTTNSKILYAMTILSIICLILRLHHIPQKSPIPLNFFKTKPLIAVVILVILSSSGLYASVTLLPIAINNYNHHNTLSSGFLITTAALGWVFGAIVCGKHLNTIGYKKMALSGMILLTSGTFLMCFALTYYIIALIAFSLLLIGLGMGFSATTTLVYTQNSAPPLYLASWTATIQFLRNLGAAFGINFLAAIQLNIVGEDGFKICFILLGCAMLSGCFISLILPNQVTNANTK